VIHDSNANVRGDARGGGQLLRDARTAAGLTVQEAATRLRMPAHVVEMLERGEWAATAAPVFVRGQLRSYARLLGVDIEPLLQTEVAPAVPVHLVSHTHTPPYQRVLESAARRAVYVVITAAIAVPVWLATRSHFVETPPSTASLDTLPAAPEIESASAAAEREPVVAPPVLPAATRSEQAPYVASMAPSVPSRSAAAVPAEAASLELSFQGESWMQVSDAQGQTVEQGLMRSGDTRSFKAGDAARIVLGNAAAVRVQQAGGIVDLTPYQRANVARFAVSSDGSVTSAE